MKLDVNVLRYLQKDEFRTLTAVEMGQKNHELVPVALIETIAGLKHGGARKCLQMLLRHKLVHHENKKYDGFRLTYLGYDFLAIKTLVNRGAIASVGRKIGVGKESDVYEVADDEGKVFCLKLHRLGRTSFRAVKSKRDYLSKGSHYSWLYLSRLAALKEYAFMKALGERGLPVPEAIDANRHAVLMSLLDAVPLVQVKKLAHPGHVYTQLIDMMERLARLGLVHCDFNEFNIMINDDEELTLIDFPQMVSSKHANALELFDRDVDCIIRFFSKKLGYVPSLDKKLARIRPDFGLADSAEDGVIDKDLRASGFKTEHQAVLEDALKEERGGRSGDHEDDSEEDRRGSGPSSSGDPSGSEDETSSSEASDDDDGSSGDSETEAPTESTPFSVADGAIPLGIEGGVLHAPSALPTTAPSGSSHDQEESASLEESSEEDATPMTRGERRVAAVARKAMAAGTSTSALASKVAADRASAAASRTPGADDASERLSVFSLATETDGDARRAAAANVLTAQRKKAARRAALISASRNASKSRNAGRRKGDSGPSTADW